MLRHFLASHKSLKQTEVWSNYIVLLYDIYLRCNNPYRHTLAKLSFVLAYTSLYMKNAGDKGVVQKLILTRCTGTLGSWHMADNIIRQYITLMKMSYLALNAQVKKVQSICSTHFVVICPEMYTSEVS